MPDINMILPNAAQFDAQNALLLRIADALGGKADPTTWGSIRDLTRVGKIGDYLDIGDQLQLQHNEMLTATVRGTGVTAAAVDKDTFLAAAGTEQQSYVFSFDGSDWYYHSEAVTLADYGITPTGTAASGDTITIHRTATLIDYDVEGIDERQPSNETLEHSLSILCHGVFSYGSIPFDPEQYLFAVTAEACEHYGWPDTGMPAGTYNITLDHGAYDGSTAQDGTYVFTTTQAVPVGGGIRHSAMGFYQSGSYTKDQITAGKFSTYGANTVTTVETNLACTEATGEETATDLGTATCSNPQYKSGDYINFTQRNAYGSGRWSTSFMRKWLNSDEATMTFTPATIWSRRPSTLPEGFLHKLDPELKAVLVKTRTRYAKSIADGYGYEDVEDLVCLETMLDVYGSQNNSISEGPVTSAGTVKRTTATSLWKDSTQADKIKYQGETARYWWLSSTYPSSAVGERSVITSGALSGNYAYNAYGVVPRLTIA